MTKLTDAIIADFEIKDKNYKISDGHGLYVLVKPNGAKLWRMKYYFRGVEKTLSFGNTKIISCEEVRGRAKEAKILLSRGHDPGQVKKVNEHQLLKSPIKILRNQVKHLEEMASRLESKKHDIENQLDDVSYDLNEVSGYLNELRMAIKHLEHTNV